MTGAALPSHESVTREKKTRSTASHAATHQAPPHFLKVDEHRPSNCPSEVSRRIRFCPMLWLRSEARQDTRQPLLHSTALSRFERSPANGLGSSTRRPPKMPNMQQVPSGMPNATQDLPCALATWRFAEPPPAASGHLGSPPSHSSMTRCIPASCP